MDEKIRDLFVKRMGLILDKRKNDAAMAAGRVRAGFAQRGTLHSSMTAIALKKAYEDLYDDICNDAWSQLHHIAVTIGVKPGDALTGELRDVFDELLMPLANQYLEALRQDKIIMDTMRASVVGEAETSFVRSRELVGTEIELFSCNTAVIVEQTRNPNYIQNYSFTGPIGAFQQGDNATATVSQYIDSAGLEALRTALDALLEKFVDHDQLSTLITEAKTEAAKPKPIMNRIRGLLTGIKACIALIKDGKELFEAAENAALECGMDSLPPMGF